MKVIPMDSMTQEPAGITDTVWSGNNNPITETLHHTAMTGILDETDSVRYSEEAVVSTNGVDRIYCKVCCGTCQNPREHLFCMAAQSGSRQKQRLEIIVDSGANNHMIPIADGLMDYAPMRGMVRLGDNNAINVKGRGTSRLVPEVLHVPDLHFGLSGDLIPMDIL